MRCGGEGRRVIAIRMGAFCCVSDVTLPGVNKTVEEELESFDLFLRSQSGWGERRNLTRPAERGMERRETDLEAHPICEDGMLGRDHVQFGQELTMGADHPQTRRGDEP